MFNCRSETTGSRFTATFVIVGLFVIGLKPACAEQVAGQASKLLSSLPSSTLAFAQSRDAAAMTAAVDRFFDSESAGSDAFRDFRMAWKDLGESAEFVKRFGLTWSDLQAMSSGEVAIIWLPGSEGGIDVAMLFDVSDAQSADATIHVITKRLTNGGYALKSNRLKSFTLDEYVHSDGDQKFLARSKNLVVISRQREAIATVCDSQHSLASNSALKRIVKDFEFDKQSQDGGSVVWMVRPWDFVEASKQQPANFALAKAQGFDAFDAIGGHLRFSPNDAERVVQYRMIVHRGGPLRNSAVALQPKPVKLTAANWMSEAFDEIQVFGFDPASVLEGYGSWFDATEGEGEFGIFDLVLEEIRDEPDGPQVDMRTEVFDQMQSPLYMLRMSGIRGDVSNDSLVAIQVKSPEVVQDAVRRMFLGDPDVSAVDFGSQQRATNGWLFGDLSRGGTRQILGPDLSGVAVCIFDDWLLTSRDQKAVRQAIRQAQDTTQPRLDESDRLRAMRAIADARPTVGNQPLVAFRYSQHADWLIPQYEQIRRGLLQTQLPGRNMRPTAVEARAFWSQMLTTFRDTWVTSEVQETLDRLPPPSELKKVVGATFDMARVDSNGHVIIEGEFLAPKRGKE